MSDANSQQEPSMEEILASIRRIISEDAEAPKAGDVPPAPVQRAAAPQVAPRPASTPAAATVAAPKSLMEDDGDDVLNLTTRADPESGRVTPPKANFTDFDFDEPPAPRPTARAQAAAPTATPTAAPAASKAGLDLSFDEDDGDDFADDGGAMGNDFTEGLMSRASASVATEAFAQLTEVARRVDEPPPRAAAPVAGPRLGSANPTLDELVREALQPVLREWLDVNLPPMVEDMVREEIQRLAAAGRRR